MPYVINHTVLPVNQSFLSDLQSDNLVSTFLVGRGVRWTASALATVSVLQTYTSGAWRRLTSVDLGWSKQCRTQ